ncbi:peptidase S41 family protein [Dactylonectria macrodidyma]|uniref:Peptidase S41 family protein n=1 Tax=Dactylonectria macrodidyma TaxID=307937 RepID=A0A9P9IQ72_9HYPO|nr:peptidase S41 family protein [Dactylonectria macrodidyma]
MRSSSVFAGLALSATASAAVPYWEGYSASTETAASQAPTPTSSPHKRGACAVIRDLYKEQLAEDPEAWVYVLPSQALKCLRSIKVDVEKDIEFIDYVLPFMEFQSTLEYLERPPPQYLIPGVDLVGGLEKIRSKLFQGSYQSQWDFVSEFKALIARVKDGHFSVSMSLDSAFSFYRGGSGLLSVSEDGCKLPKVYLYEDVQNSKLDGYKMSDVTSVDGVPILEYLDTITSLGSGQDPDALHNELFESSSKTGQGYGGSFQSIGYPYMKDETVFKLANGSSITVENYASVNVDFTTINSPEDLHEQVEIPAEVSETASVPTTTAVPTIDPSTTYTDSETATSSYDSSPTLDGYPYPVAKHFDGWISGYFLNDTDYEDVGVLVLNSFSGSSDDSTADLNEFYRVLSTFLRKFEKAGKERLVIDLQSNGGGYLAAAVDLLFELLPEIVPNDGYRLRATEVLNWIGKSSYKENPTLFGAYENEKGKVYRSWKKIFGPQVFNGDDFTHLLANSLDDETFYEDGGFPTNSTLPAGTLKPENIIILTDADCHSSCPLFTGWMSRLGGVRTVAVGGRPMKAPMQAMGGTKGGAVYAFTDVQGAINVALNKTDGLVPHALELPSVNESPLVLGYTALNMQNQYLPDWKSGTPLQFVYEAANCKLFYTPETALNVTNLWQAVADVAWNGAKCVPGSTVSDDDTISDKKVRFSPAVWSKAVWPVVPGGFKTVGGNNFEPDATSHRVKKRIDQDDERTRFVQPGPLPGKRGPIIF